jgi:hypothetical protein
VANHLRLFQNFSFERATSEKGRFAGLSPVKRQSLGKTNRVLQEAQYNKKSVRELCE